MNNLGLTRIRRVQLKKESQKKKETCKPNYQVILHQRNKAFYRNYEKLESPLFWIPKIANFCRKLPKNKQFVILDFDCSTTTDYETAKKSKTITLKKRGQVCRYFART